MGMLRTINHPAVETVEVDLSDYVSLVGGTTSLVLGFSPQGQSGVPVIPTSTNSVKSYFGTPKTEAERYFYYACKEVFDKGGRLIAARIPYNNNAQYLTPAVTYDIEEWQTTYVNDFGLDASYDETHLIDGKDIILINDDSDTKLQVNGRGYSHHDIFHGTIARSKTCDAYSASTTYLPGMLSKLTLELPAFNSASSYAESFRVAYNSNFFQSITAVPSGHAPSGGSLDQYWTQIHPNEYFSANIQCKGKSPRAVVGVWSSGTTYAKDTLAKLSGFTHCFKSEIASNKSPIYADGETVTEWSSMSSYAASEWVKKTTNEGNEYYQAKTVVTSGIDPSSDVGSEYWKEDDLESKWSYTDIDGYWTSYDNDETAAVKTNPNVTAQSIGEISDNPVVRVDKFVDANNMSVVVDYTGSMSGRAIYIELTDAGKTAFANYLYKSANTITATDIVNNIAVLSSADYFEEHYYVKPSSTVIDGKEYTGKDIIEGCVYNPVHKYPQLKSVEEYTVIGNTDQVGVQMFYNKGRSVYPNCQPTDFIKLTLTTEGEDAMLAAGAEQSGGKTTVDGIIKNVKVLSSAEYFSLTRMQFAEFVEERTATLGDFFVSAPVTSDVTTGYGSVSEALAISSAEGLDWSTVSANYPTLENKDPFSCDGWMKVATKIPQIPSYSYKSTEFYQFVSNFSSIKDVATTGSQNYQWIHWVQKPTSTSTLSPTESAYVDNSLVMARTIGCELSDVPNGFGNVENVVTIKPNTDHFGFITLSAYQDYRDGVEKPAANKIVICNINEKQFGKDIYNNSGMECLGIMPVLIGGAQAVPKQQLVTLPKDIGNGRIFNAVEAAVRGSLYDLNVPESDGIDCTYGKLNGEGFYKKLCNTEKFNAFESNISNDLLAKVPTIQLDQNMRPNATAKNSVTLVVCELATSKSFDNKVYVNVLESFTGSLNPKAVDSSNKSLYIDNIVNSEDSGSSYVRIFSNWQTEMKAYSERNLLSETYRNTPTEENTVTMCVPASLGSENWFVTEKESMSLGFVEEQTKKYIAYSTIAGTIESVFDTLANVDEQEIDVVVDAGLSTVANRIKKLADDDASKVKFEYDTFWNKISSVDDAAGWKAICAKYITFCSSTRKDCMAVVDAPRNVSVKDAVKLAQPGGKYSVDFDILPTLNYISGLNSSYCAQYLNWISYVDDFSGKTVWLPPSIAANGAIIYTDYNYQYFDAPAGTRRGRVTAGIDVSFNPSGPQQDIIYNRSWNYYISTVHDGIVLWGQKTSQSRSSALDRVNVRRLLLRLERFTRKAMKQFIFEGNTEKLRNKVIDTLTPIYENCKTNGGLYDYRIVCDTLNNTPTTIDNNELRVAIGVKPTKTAEFIHCTWFIMSTGADFSEMDSQL